MTLLFKTDKDFSAQFKEILGFVDADFRYINIKAKLIAATQELIDLIGQATYDEIESVYTTDTDTDNHKVYLAQSSIAINAYRLYAPNNDLSHSNNGRASRKSDENGVAFEWMLERSDKQLERDYYKAVDQLLEYLENEKSNVWLNSDSRAKHNQYFINTTKDFEEFFPIESRLLLMKLIPSIRKYEREKVLPVIGVLKYDAYKTLIKAGAGITPTMLPMYKLIQEALVNYAFAWAMDHLTVQLLPDGMLQKYSSDRVTVRGTKVPEQLQTQLAGEKFLLNGNRIMSDIEALIEKENELNTQYKSPEDFIHDFGFDEDDSFVDS